MTDHDELYDAASRLVVKEQKPSVSLLQRALRIGFTWADALLKTMEVDGLVTAPGGGLRMREMLVPADYLVAVDAELAKADAK